MSHAYAHVVKHAFAESKKLQPVGQGKNAMVAFVAGFLFGPIGIGVYLKSGTDFFILLALLILGSVMTGGIAAPLLWILCGAWGWVRVNNSNKAAAELSA